MDVGTIKAKPLISKARPAHEFRLPIFNGGQQFISLNQFKGKVVLLDFWIIHCGPCIEVIPKVKNLVKNFDKNDLVFLSVNAYDSASQIRSFQSKYPAADYDILYNGREVADQYGVRAFPTFVLIDKKGMVLYAGVIMKKSCMTLFVHNFNKYCIIGFYFHLSPQKPFFL